MDKHVCRWCGKAFVPDAKSLRNPNYRAEFCSRICANKGRSKPLRQRFAEYMAAAPVSEAGCWLWPGPRASNGYGAITDEGRRQLGAHRVSYEINIGPIPGGKQVLHACDNRLCINPAHLSLGTSTDNMADRDAKGRQASGDRHGSVTHPERVPRGEQAGLAKLRETDIPAIRARYASGETQKALAAAYGVSQGTIFQVVHRWTWSHIP